MYVMCAGYGDVGESAIRCFALRDRNITRPVAAAGIADYA